jgi:hypothetical protein
MPNSVLQPTATIAAHGVLQPPRLLRMAAAEHNVRKAESITRSRKRIRAPSFDAPATMPRPRSTPCHHAKTRITERKRITPSQIFCFLCACVLVVVPTPAEAFELSGGVSVGGIQVGTDPSLAVSPFVGLLWRTERGFLLEAHNMFSILPGSRVGLHDRTSATLGYTWQTGNFSLGPSLSFYSMPACGPVMCRRVEGAAPGGHAQTDWYFKGPLGVSVSANVAWYGGSSFVLAGNAAVMVTAGPILRLETK